MYKKNLKKYVIKKQFTHAMSCSSNVHFFIKKNILIKFNLFNFRLEIHWKND